MLDEILDLFGRKKKSAAGTRQGGIGGLLTRVQDTLEGESESRRSADPSRSSERRFDRDDDSFRSSDDRDREHRDRDDDDDDRGGHRGRRRERDGFDLGDD